ncbi:MAG: ABC transporter permease [Planctomycetes bacterium]|nr:ABC transporter permease [Planctomycetota bacterium]
MLKLFLWLLFSILVTWVIGLSSVILIRYVLLRRPLSRKISILLATFFWVVNIVIFILLGSKSGTHVSLFIVYLISCYIYQTPNSIKVLLSNFISELYSCCYYINFFLWLRYLHKKKIVLLSVAAVALSSALLIVVASLFLGFIGAFEQSAVDAMGDIIIEPPVKLARYPEFIERLEREEVIKAATATLLSNGLLHLGQGNVRAVKIWGIQAGKRAKVTGLRRSLLRQKHLRFDPSFNVENAEDIPGGFIGIGVVTEPDEKSDEYDFDKALDMIGKYVVLTTGAVTETKSPTENNAKRFKRKPIKFAVVDIVFTGVYDLDKNFIYLSIDMLQKKIYPDRTDPIADQIQIKLADDASSADGLEAVRRVWSEFASQELGWSKYFISETVIITSKEMQSRYVSELRKQMGVLLLIFGVVSLSVVLLILCIFYMIVETRQKDIAIIKSCGTPSSSVALLFLGFGGFVGVIGSAFGVLFAYIITKNINAIEEWIRLVFGLKLWKSSVYMFSSIPNEIDWGSTLIIVLFAIVAAAMGALIPAIVAVQIKPVNILRYE